MKEITIFDVAIWFLKEKSMSPKKLQKMCWYAYSWFVFLKNEGSDQIENKLFDAKFEAWVHGPANPELYSKYREYGYNLVPIVNRNVTTGTALDSQMSEESKFLKEIYEVYGDDSADELESLTHQELPWLRARAGLRYHESSNNPLKIEDIFEEYAGR